MAEQPEVGLLHQLPEVRQKPIFDLFDLLTRQPAYLAVDAVRIEEPKILLEFLAHLVVFEMVSRFDQTAEGCESLLLLRIVDLPQKSLDQSVL
ncbi:MAG: hypothetical protein HOL01_00010 [Planctomycetaceae bacterium]|nr:hypothetical protein [Planctomycetaceae bacterium]